MLPVSPTDDNDHNLNLSPSLSAAAHYDSLPVDGTWKEWVLPSLLVCLLLLAWFGGPPFAMVAIVVQLTIMGCIVFWSSAHARVPLRDRTPWANVLRAVAGSLGAAALELGVGWAIGRASNGLCVLGLLSSVCFFTYVSAALSDYMFHRFVWHAHWASTTHGVSVLFKAVRRHYVQHFLGHHTHSRHPHTVKAMRAHHAQPMTSKRKRVIEQSMPVREDVDVLHCSNHGFTVGASAVPLFHRWGCLLHTPLMLLSMPAGTAALLQLGAGRAAGLLHLVACTFPLYLTVHHDIYHADPEQRQKWGATWRWAPLRWLWTSSEMGRMIDEHLQHHHSDAHRERHFGLMPFGRYFIFPVWQSW